MKKLFILIVTVLSFMTTFAQTSTCPEPTFTGVAGITSTSAFLQWGYQAGAASASAWELGIVPTGSGAPTSGLALTTNQYTITGLTPATTYDFYVRSVCGTGIFSTWTFQQSFTTLTSCPAPTNVATTGTTTTSTIVGWTESGTATQWNVTVTGGGTTVTYPATSIPYIITGLNPSTSYTISVTAVCAPNVLSGQSATATVTTQSLPVVCGGQFFDNGGANAFYTNSSDVTTTIFPTNAGDKVTVTFTSFDVEANFDGLYVYNGNAITAPQIASTNAAPTNSSGLTAGAFWGTNVPGPFTSSAADGSLTFRFRSDSSVNKAGWVANVTCAPAPTCPQPISLVSSNPTYNSITLNWTETGTAPVWEVLVLPISSPAPTAATTGGVLVTSRPYTITGLTIGTSYKVFVRSICSATDFSAWTGSTVTTLACTAPSVTAQAGTSASGSATVNWTANTSSQYEILILPSTATTPSATTSGTAITTNTHIFTGLTCGTSYKVFVRTACTPTSFSSWSSGTTFSMPSCTLTTGAPQNMTACSDNGQNCFTLTNNDAPILNGLAAADYIIGYFTDANRTIAAVSPYCLTNATTTIYVKLTKIATSQTQLFTFTVTSNSLNATQVLPVMSGCDDNFDGFVVFNLTTAPITTTNTLQYYTTLANATAQTNPLANPTVYSMAITATTTTIFIREIIAGACDNVYSMQLGAYADCNLAYNCANANSLCGALGVPFANTHQGIAAETGNAYGCLATRPNPTWFYIHVSNSGSINLKIEQNSNITFPAGSVGQDVDYIVYGPFATNPTANCGTLSQIVSCSYSSAAVEYPVIANALAGQYYLIMTTNFSNQLGFIRINTLPTSTGAIDCSGIRMNAFIDNNTNGTQEVGEVNFPLGQFHYTMNGGAMHNVVSPTGNYTIYDNNATNLYNLSYTIDPLFSAEYGITTSSYTGISVVTNGGSTTYNFPITITRPYKDLAVAIIPLSAPRAGATYKNLVAYTNLGNQTLPTGTVNFNKDAATTITTISQAGTTPTATGFSYNFTNLLPFEVRYITVTMSVPPIPTVAIGQLLTNTANIIPPTGDINPLNDFSSSTQAIIAAYDPNDKTEAHGEKVLFSSFNPNEYLTYTIRFENLGNASAIDVRVVDVLDSGIDETSIKMVAASHPYILDRVNNNLTWNFENIQLPVSVANTDIGKGFITFQAKLRPGFAIGSIIPNTASIYFDTNPAVITNTFNTEFTAALASAQFDLTNFGLYPNPANDMVYINLQNTDEQLSSIEITDMLGKSIQKSNNIGAKQTAINVANFAKGMYMVNIQTESGLKQTKKLMVE